MCNLDRHGLKQTFNKWLIALVLLTSVFAFSGLSISAQAGASPVQSTWIVRGGKPAVNSIQFSTNRPYLPKQHKAEFKGYTTAHLSLFHTKTFEVKWKRCQDSHLTGSYKMMIGLRKTIPQNGKIEPAPILV